jgi:Protein of unknown function (DUF2782)
MTGLKLNVCGLRTCLPLTVALTLGFSTFLMAQDELEVPPAIPPEGSPEAPLPPKIKGEEIEPTVTIREEEERTVEEYSYNGVVYMVKVTPNIGPPYYLIDSDGDGNLETAPDKGLSPVQPIQWKIKEWD